jgi:hypothetical protein
MAYSVFVRTWWRPKKGGGLEPRAGRKMRAGHPQNVTQDQARDYCRVYNANHPPGRLSRKAEYESK